MSQNVFRVQEKIAGPLAIRKRQAAVGCGPANLKESTLIIDNII